ncbi:MAG: hypothetical protein COB90_07985 [Hyphomicrobiales bacterium]|nr:MAG: hypothetical protein COB90_07985 [Hyphomicrobiales bacterium]
MTDGLPAIYQFGQYSGFGFITSSLIIRLSSRSATSLGSLAYTIKPPSCVSVVFALKSNSCTAAISADIIVFTF